ncbi:MAG: acyl-CoA dehydrogenase [Bradyrhizobium sp.]|nr:acyl-CoA dehydrogenase [Bradyrhizobium sp.]
MDDDQAKMIRELVAKFVKRELIPLENEYLQRKSCGIEPALAPEHVDRLRATSKELGLWGLDAPVDMGGMDLPTAVMAQVNEEMAKTPVQFQLPPDSPNLRMLQAIGTEEQKRKYLQPYIDGTITSAMAISEPGAGGDPAGIRTRAEETADGWLINGRKIWISLAKTADFAIVMARVGAGDRRSGITSFIVERGTPGYIVEREIKMVGGGYTYEVVFEDCLVPFDNLLGTVGQGYEPMQLRLRTRRLEMGSTAIGIAQRALDVLVEHANQRVTFGVKLADRQAIQWWVADMASRLYAARLMVQDAAAKVDRGEDVAQEISMIKVFATELAYEATDHAMQTLGALGMTQETVLYPMWQRARLMRIYEGPSEVHRQAIARRVLSGRS